MVETYRRSERIELQGMLDCYGRGKLYLRLLPVVFCTRNINLKSLFMVSIKQF